MYFPVAVFELQIKLHKKEISINQTRFFDFWQKTKFHPGRLPVNATLSLSVV